MKLKWTHEKPKSDGWYWVKREWSVPEIFHVRWYVDELCIGNWAIPDNAEWAGPVPIPLDKDP